MKLEHKAAEACAACTLARQTDGIDRLTFLKQSAAGIAALALAACGGSSPTAPGTVSSTTLSLASNPALSTVGGVVTIRIDGSPVAVVRESSTTFAAFSLICPHQGATVQRKHPNSIVRDTGPRSISRASGPAANARAISDRIPRSTTRRPAP